MPDNGRSSPPHRWDGQLVAVRGVGAAAEVDGPAVGIRLVARQDSRVAAADDQIQRLTDGLDGLTAAAERGEENRKAETERQIAALDALLASAVAGQVRELAQIAESARDTLKGREGRQGAARFVARSP